MRLGSDSDHAAACITPWCLGWHGGMDYRDYYEGLYRDYCRHPFPHFLLSTKEIISDVVVPGSLHSYCIYLV